ncbi:MAG TPA: cytochrome c oxidase subunit II [Rhodocyclaceae bacterium]|nr:cytochrome c oxidase subunit II [Rhodocyclaceae bacterium]
MRFPARLAASASLFAVAHGVSAQSRFNLQPPITEVGERIYDLHTLMLVICLVIFVVVFGAMFWAVFHHRKSRGVAAAHFHENTAVEIVWTIIPFLILMGMAWPATKAIIEMKDTSEPDLTIKATGYQWKWGYDYLQGEGEGIRYLSSLATPRAQIDGREAKGEHYLLEVDHPLVVPVGKKVRLLTTANDVIHAWWVPALGVKQDAIPGFIRDAWFRAEREGVYRGVCAELCGRDHGFMPIEVHVVSEQAYGEWVGKQLAARAEQAADEMREWTAEQLVERGETVYGTHCVACHQADGKGVPPAFPPLDGSAVVRGEHGPLLDTVLNGRSGTAMAAFGAQLSDSDIAAVTSYVRNAWSNAVGDVVRPADVAEAR